MDQSEVKQNMNAKVDVLVRKGGFEPPRLTAPPPQDGASASSATSAFTAAGWEGSFYPKGTKPADFLSFYATRFNSVEVDSTFYRTPSKVTVQEWDKKTPQGFVFAAKVPQLVTHEKVLVDCDAEFKEFVQTSFTLHSFPDVIWSILFIIRCMSSIMGLVSSFRNESQTRVINNGKTRSPSGSRFLLK